MQLAGLQPKLEALGIKALGVLSSDEERARVYFRARPTSLALAADATRSVHRAFRVPFLSIVSREAAVGPGWPQQATFEELRRVKLDPGGELGAPTPVPEARVELNRRDGFEMTFEDEHMRAQGHQWLGLFLIDRDGIIRWRWVEAMHSPETVRTFPAETELLDAARAI